MEKSNEQPSISKPEAVVCPICDSSFDNGECQCPGPPNRSSKVARGMCSSQLFNGASLLKHTKSNVSYVPDTLVRLTPSSDTKSRQTSADETKLPISNVRVRNECLSYDKEAVNVGSSSTVGSDLNIFEIDIDCVDSTVVVRNESSHAGKKQLSLERTPVKQSRVQIPKAPLKQPQAPSPSTPGDHRDYVAPAPRHACPYCSKTFRSNGKLNNHVFSHTGERPFACKHCQKAFSSKFKLCRHVLIHSEERKFLCTVCERRFLRNDHLKNHYKVHDPRKILFRCERAGCGKEYSSAISQRKHEAWHRAQDGDLTCLLCHIKHETMADLLLHLRRHSGSRMLKSPADRKFRCHLCERHFLTRKDVTRHLVVHTGERDFLCQFCPQRFGRKDHLLRHIKKSHHASSKRKSTKQSNKSKAGQTDAHQSDASLDDDEDEPSLVIDDDDSTPEPSDDDLNISGATQSEIDDSKVPTDLEEIQTSDMILMSEPSPPYLPSSISPELTKLSKSNDIFQCESSKHALLTKPKRHQPFSEKPAKPSVAFKTEPSMSIDIFEEESSVSSDILIPQSISTQVLPSTSKVLTDDVLNSEEQLDLFNFQPVEGTSFESGSVSPAMPPPTSLLVDEDKKDGDLFEGTSQSLMFSEPSFDDEEYKSSDFLLPQGEPCGELLRYLLQADADAPLPGFSQSFNNNSCPPNT